MDARSLKEAETEAKRFLERLAELRSVVGEGQGSFWPSKESGALRRTSMELTRALAKMRKPA